MIADFKLSFKLFRPARRIVTGCSLVGTLSVEQAYVINMLCHVVLSIILPYLLLVIFSMCILQALHCRRLTRPSGGSQVVSRLSRKITVR